MVLVYGYGKEKAKQQEQQMTSKMIKVIRSVVGPDAVIFNDKLVDGTRSVKIWGIRYNYGPTIKALTANGFSVKLVDGFNGRTRLHVC